jgi:hypothetical protein
VTAIDPRGRPGPAVRVMRIVSTLTVFASPQGRTDSRQRLKMLLAAMPLPVRGAQRRRRGQGPPEAHGLVPDSIAEGRWAGSPTARPDVPRNQGDYLPDFKVNRARGHTRSRGMVGELFIPGSLVIIGIGNRLPVALKIGR